MPRSRLVAMASFAAAELVGPGIGSTRPASATAAHELGARAAREAERALATSPCSRCTRRLLAQARRRLRFAYTITVGLEAAGEPDALDAAVEFTAAAAHAADRFALIAQRSDGRVQAVAVRALRRTAWHQGEVVRAIAESAEARSPARLAEAMHAALRHQEHLVVSLASVAASDEVAYRQGRSGRFALKQADEAREALAASLARARAAAGDLAPVPEAGRRADGRGRVEHRDGRARVALAGVARVRPRR